MTVAPPAQPILPPTRRPWGILVLVVVVLAVIAFLAISSIGSALVYYLTPTELIARGEAATQTDVRLGGQVKEGSIVESEGGVTFILTDGMTEITVTATTIPPRSFREGAGAVVEGRLGIHGAFEATQVIVKHDETYVAPEPGALPSEQVIDPGEDAP